MRKQKKALHPDIYDALEFSALAFGGIGKGEWFVDDPKGGRDIPCCGEGHAIAICHPTSNDYGERTEALRALEAIGVDFIHNDEAVNAINKRLRRPLNTLVTFKRWAKELGVVRAVVHEGSEVVGMTDTGALVL